MWRDLLRRRQKQQHSFVSPFGHYNFAVNRSKIKSKCALLPVATVRYRCNENEFNIPSYASNRQRVLCFTTNVPESKSEAHHRRLNSAISTALLESFPLNVQQTIQSLQNHFHNNCNDNGLFELYDPTNTDKMWKSVQNMNKTFESKSIEKGEINKTAGVLVLFVVDNANTINEDSNDLSIVLTRRSKHLSAHASQISFPGGHYDDSKDSTIIDTCIREAVEELYSNNNENNHSTIVNEFRQRLFVFGCTTDVPSMRGLPVTSVLALYYNDSDSNKSFDVNQLWTGNPSEVELVFTVPIKLLIQAHDEVSTKRKPTLTSSEDTMQSRTKSMSSSSSPQYPTENGTIWGLTAYILKPIIEKILIPYNDDKE